MAIELKVPAVGESVSEAVIGEWLKAEGDWVDQDEPVVLIETDKASMEIPAPASGTLKKILKQEGDSAEIGEVIAHLEEGERSADTSDAEEKPASEAEIEAEDETETEDKGEGEDDEPETRTEDGDATPEATEPAKKDDSGASEAQKGPAPRVTPAARRALAEAGLEARDVEATGPGGRLLKEDVLRHTAGPSKTPAPSPEPPPDGSGASRQEETVRMTPLRKTVARRLVEAQQTAALLTTFNEIDMSRTMALRRDYKDAFLDRHGVKLGFMSFFVKAAIEALKAFPGVNAELRGSEIVYHNYFDIGIAVGGGKGLVVPVIRNAELLSFAEIETTIGDFAKRAKDGKLALDELRGGTFTISNGGVYGSLLSTPIVNPPQSGILGLHKIEERPVAVDGQVEIRPMMYVALTYDHRLVDGREAVGFLIAIKERIEDPARILLEV